MNPSTQELLEACQSVASAQVILLPNNGNVIMSARQVPQLIQGKEIYVVPSDSLTQGVGALLAYNYEAEFAANCQAMEAALAGVHTVEITRAVRTVQIDGVNVNEGDIIGLVNGKLIAAGRDLDPIVRDALRRAGVEKLEIVTLYYGADAAAADAEALAGRIRGWFPGREVEVVNGGQPYYAFILSVE